MSEVNTTADNVPTSAPWFEAFPAPRSTPARIEREQLHAWIKEHGVASKEFLVIDVRRTDFELAFIRGAINLPAHSFYPTLPSLLPVLLPYKRLIFHCQSSSGRGPRCAGWLQDALDSLSLVEEEESDANRLPEVLVLTGGIKKWFEVYGKDESLTVPISGFGWTA